MNNGQFPGFDAQRKMAPPTRNAILSEIIEKFSKTAKKAAVLCLLYPKNNQLYFALIKRVSYEGVHSNQIGFPGGKLEAGENSLQAAIRETEEEIGVKISESSILGPITELYIPPSNFMVYPYIAYINFLPSFILDKKEVAYLVEVSLADLLNADNIKTKEMKLSYGTFNNPYFSLQNEVVWGATAMILNEFRDILMKQNQSKWI